MVKKRIMDILILMIMVGALGKISPVLAQTREDLVRDILSLLVLLVIVLGVILVAIVYIMYRAETRKKADSTVFFCKFCGKENSQDAEFCQKCGKKIA